MAVLSILSNGQTIYPEVLTYVVEDVPIVNDTQHVNGNLRRAYQALKRRLTYARSNLTEAEAATWETAHPYTASYSHRDLDNVTRTVITESLIRTLERTNPATNTSTWRVEVTVRQV